MFSPNLDRRQLARWTTLLLMVGILSVLVFMGARTANAGVIIYVTPNVGEGLPGDSICSLREAVAMAGDSVANPDCTVIYGTNFPAGYNVVYVPPGDYNLNPANGPLILRRNVRLRGPQVNIPAGNVETFTTRPISISSEAIIRYNGSLDNLPIIRVQGANIEIEGLTFTSGSGTQTNLYAINFQGLFSDVEISNNIFSDLTYGIAMRTATGLPNDVVGNAFINLTRTGTLRGIGIHFPSIGGENIQIENNVFINLPNYAIHFPTIGSFNLASNVTINGNGFSNVSAVARLNRNNTVDITGNRVNTVTGSPSTFPAAVVINNSTGVNINANSFVSSTIPAIRTTGTLNDLISINGNRFYNNDLTSPFPGNAVVFDSGSFVSLGEANLDDNWWGDNAGPGAGVNGFNDLAGVLGTPTWAAYQIVAAPAPIGLPNPGNMQSELLVDFFRTDDGTTNIDDLDGFAVMRRGTQINVSLPLVPSPIGTLDTSVVRVINDQTNRFRFTSDSINPGTQTINAALDNEIVSFNLNVNTPNQVICDFNEPVFSDPGVHITEGATIGDRCILRLTGNPGPSNFVDVTISSTDPTLVGFYNGNFGAPINLSDPPNTTFNVRFGAVANSSASPPVVKWDTGIAINFNALINTSDAAGPQSYNSLVTCAVSNIVGTPPYSVGGCPGLPAIPVTIYDAGITFDIVNSDLDLGVDETDVCTFPAFNRTYGIRLSGPPGLRAVAPFVGVETVTVNVVSGTPTIVTVTPASLSFNRSNWNTAQNVTLQRNNAFYTGAVNPNNPASVTINHNTTSDITGGSTNSQYGTGVSRTLTVIRPGCPLMDKEGASVDVGISQSVSAASVNVGDAINYYISYWGDGLANADPSAAGLVVNINIPANVAFLGISEANSSFCAAPNEGQMGPVTVTCVFPAGIAVNGGMVSVMTVAAAPGVASVSADVSVFGANDINAANNTTTAEALIN
jgi:hypothetical protein